VTDAKYNDYSLGSFTLIATAAIVLLTVALTNRGDLTSATLTLAGIACFTGGIFLLTFSKDDPIDATISSLLLVPGTTTISRLCADLGIQGNAWFIPSEKGIQQFIPAGDLRNLPDTAQDFSYSIGASDCGVLIPPAGMPLLTLLKRDHALILPRGEIQLLEGIESTFEHTLELADHVKVRRAGENILVDLIGYRLFDGCLAVQSASPKCCTLSPCPVCSLTACLLAEGLLRTVTIDRTTINRKDRSVHMVLSMGEEMPKKGL
jgi:hypothetical protein